MAYFLVRRRLALRGKLIVLVVASLLVVFGAATAFTIHRVNGILSSQAESSARLLAQTVGASVQVFGETGDMDGLKMFLKAAGESEDITEVFAARSPVTDADFGKREGSEPRDETEAEVLRTGMARTIADAQQIRFVLPMRTEERCISCHEAASPGDVLGSTSVVISTARANAQAASQSGVLAGIFTVAIALVAVLLSFAITRSVIRPITRIIGGLEKGADQVNDAASQVSAASQDLAEGANQQASSLEETSAALEQMAAMTRTNAENSQQANRFAGQAREAAVEGDGSMSKLNDAMAGMNESSDRISRIIKVIEEIAFQTNLLALNAAVEAARAGEHGKGFAVVADEVRNLAMRAAEAARQTTGLIEDAVRRAKDGTQVAADAGVSLNTIAGHATKVSDLIDAITRASQEQAQGVEQVNTAVAQMDRVTQRNAAGAEESANAAEELSAQSQRLKGIVRELAAIVVGDSGH